MESVSEYSGNINSNITSKLGFLINTTPDIEELIRPSPSTSGSILKSSRKRLVVDDSPSWFRVRPIRKRRSKYNSEDSDSDYEDVTDNVIEQPHIESLENVERRLGLTKRPNQYGAIEGVVIGQWWKTRMECSHAGAHRPTVAGIHPGPEGAYSVALSGGYEGDWDLGDEFTFTGEGGRDLKGTKANPKNLRTAPQSKDQVLSRGNLALHKSFENGNLVRVIRGYKLQSVYAPEDGYRYDGLYRVVKCWTCTGKAGFLIYKFHFGRVENQLPLIDSMENVLLFTSIKKRKSSTRQGLRKRSSLKKSDAVAAESFDEDSEQESRNSHSLFRSPKESDVEEEIEIPVKLFYQEASDSEDMFYKGRFLGWNNSIDYENTAKTFQKMLVKLEDSMIDFSFQDNCSGDETSLDDEDLISFPNSSSAEFAGNGHRRKTQNS